MADAYFDDDLGYLAEDDMDELEDFIDDDAAERRQRRRRPRSRNRRNWDSDVQKLALAVKKLKEQFEKQQQLQMMLMLFASDKSYVVTKASKTELEGAELRLKEDGDSLAELLPLLAMSGSGGGGDLMNNPLLLKLLLDKDD